MPLALQAAYERVSDQQAVRPAGLSLAARR
jgi:hypothetical protein